MAETLGLNSINEIVESIGRSIGRAQSSFDNSMLRNESADDRVQHHLELAFLKLRLFLEAAKLPEILNSVKQLEVLAKEDYSKVDVSPESGEPYLIWGYKLRHHLIAIECVFGEPKAGIVTKDIVEILKAAQYSITDPNCFECPPKNERDIHVRIEAVLRCIFPDLIHKPKITKQIKHFEPDTGIPSIRTLIEYKFVTSNDDARRTCEEVLADTRGYISKEWDSCIYVIYETKRIKSEKQWTQLLRTSEVGTNTNIIVIHGEEPKEGVATAGGALS